MSCNLSTSEYIRALSSAGAEHTANQSYDQEEHENSYQHSATRFTDHLKICKLTFFKGKSKY